MPIEPQFKTFEALKPDWAMEVVCKDIYKHLNIAIPPRGGRDSSLHRRVRNPRGVLRAASHKPSFDPLDVAAIYTYRAEPAETNAVAIDVTVFPAKSNRYTIPLIIAVPADGTVSPVSSRGKQLQKE